MTIKNKYLFAKLICKYLPPIISQRVRDFIIKISEGESLSLDFKAKSFTGSYFYGNTSDFHAFKFSVHGYFDWRNVIICNEVLKKYKGHIIEVGANVGTETISFSDIANKFGMQVFAYEPLPVNYDVLFRNKMKNKFENLNIYSNLVSNESGKAKFKIPDKRSSGSGHITYNLEDSFEEFKVVTLDESLPNQDISFMSIDVEGFEYQVLLGASEIIKANMPVIVAEANKNYIESRGNISLVDFYKYFSDLDYVCYYICRTGIKKIDVLEYSVRTNKNWLCIPKNKIGLVNSVNQALFLNAFNPFIRNVFY